MLKVAQQFLVLIQIADVESFAVCTAVMQALVNLANLSLLLHVLHFSFADFHRKTSSDRVAGVYEKQMRSHAGPDVLRVEECEELQFSREELVLVYCV